MTGEKVWEFIHPDSLYCPSISGVQRLPNGNTLITFGNLQWIGKGSIITEVDPNNQIVFQLECENGGNIYRAQKYDWFFHTPNLIPDINTKDRLLIKIIDVLGRSHNLKENTLLFYIYNDGTIEKKIIVK